MTPQEYQPLNERAFGFAMGVGYAATMALYALTMGFCARGRKAAELTAEFYPGFRPGPVGALIGAAYGFAMGVPFGWVLARAYNKIQACCPRMRGHREEPSPEQTQR